MSIGIIAIFVIASVGGINFIGFIALLPINPIVSMTEFSRPRYVKSVVVFDRPHTYKYVGLSRSLPTPENSFSA
jgi:hypothetical protein